MRIRQPLAFLGFSFMAGLFICAWLTMGQIKIFLALGTVILGLGIWLFYKKKLLFLLLLGFMLSLSAGITLYRQHVILEKWEIAAGQEVTLTGQVGQGDADTGWIIQEASLTWEGQQLTADLLLSGDQDLLLYEGEQISIEANISEKLPTSSQLAKGAQLKARGDSATLHILSGRSLGGRFREKILRFLQSHLRRAISDTSAADLMAAMLTGDDSAIPQRLYGLFQRSGIAHILCVSGLHLSLMAGLATSLLSFLGRRPALIGSLAVMSIFVWLTGAGASASRAFIMAALAILAELLYRDSTPVNALGGVVLLLTLIQPALICQRGFLLSVSSVLAITAIAPAWLDTLDRLYYLEERPFLRYIAGLLLPSVAISLTTLPIMALFFGYAPLASPLTNLFILPLMPVLLCCGLLAGIFSLGPAGWLCEKILAWIQIVAEWGVKGPILPLRSQIFLLGMVCSALLVAVVFLLNGKSTSRTAAGLLSVFILGWASFLDHTAQKGTISILQVSQSNGSSIVLQSGNQAVLVGCGGSSYEGRMLTDLLLSLGVSELSAVVVPADKLYYTGGAYSVLTALGAEKVIAPESSRISQALDFSQVDAVYPLVSSSWNLFSAGELRVHTGGSQAVIFVDLCGRRISLDYERNPVAYPADLRIFCDKIQEAADTTRGNYVIMESTNAQAGSVIKWTFSPDEDAL